MWSIDYEHYPEKICQGYDGIWYGIFENGKYSIARKRKMLGLTVLKRLKSNQENMQFLQPIRAAMQVMSFQKRTI